MDSAVDTLQDPAPSNMSPSESAYRQLRDRLLIGGFPLTRQLAEKRLAAMFGVSRTPVRHALIRLHGEGLVSQHAQGGYRPAVPDPNDIACLYEARRALEIGALWRPEEAGTSHDRGKLDALREDWEALRRDPPPADAEFVTTDEDFHIRLAQAAGNEVVADLLRSVNARIRVIRIHDFLSDDRIEVTIGEHLGILQAVAADDPAGAEKLFRAHLAKSKEIAEERALRAIARMATLD
ncbi:transcriptional regulator, GntR family [Catenulispora acidiphila DSM 44928]|uniref:Transcriptional regulator, GntR family n=1 Tax=Catenulispora acidiphila (strain DSM 44928 / JCM 14897 / NBRC 102108 / NRRL B-24433 / ID139908) TaxID=479433 RepID=C7PWM1_CATAD|nr:GntR family transcriptional regulator [Catenulispora acidiphila]ACU75301.1 transcriptional regulator, GntR family [Catenulispora acidiphila DSM 44928]